MFLTNLFPSYLQYCCRVYLGRTVITEHELDSGERICIVNVYCPMAVTENKERFEFKMNFYKLLEARCRKLEQAGK